MVGGEPQFDGWSSKDMAMKALERATEIAAQFLAHERQCTERWLANQKAWHEVDRRLTEQNESSTTHRGLVYEKFDRLNGKMFGILLSVVASTIGTAAFLAFYIMTHK